MRLDHPIFKGPLAPKLDLGSIDTPQDYRSNPAGKDLPAKMDAWKVQTGKFPDEIDVGLVSSPYGFEDSPDTEWISSGVNSKGPRSVALGRHGNFFLWGFAGDPSQMTESARRVFVNAVAYMKRFDGKSPLVAPLSQSRELALVYAAYLPKYAGADWLKKMFPEEVRERTGLDAAKVEAYYKESLEYVRVDNGAFAVDADAKTLGVSNRKSAFLDKVLERLAGDGKDALAWRLVERYVERKFAEPAEFRAWVESNRPWLFFSDVGGYRWFVDEHSKRAAEVR
jgi:hypothetical protein